MFLPTVKSSDARGYSLVQAGNPAASDSTAGQQFAAIPAIATMATR
jgi:hypothetical protein